MTDRHASNHNTSPLCAPCMSSLRSREAVGVNTDRHFWRHWRKRTTIVSYITRRKRRRRRQSMSLRRVGLRLCWLAYNMLAVTTNFPQTRILISSVSGCLASGLRASFRGHFHDITVDSCDHSCLRAVCSDSTRKLTLNTSQHSWTLLVLGKLINVALFTQTRLTTPTTPLLLLMHM